MTEKQKKRLYLDYAAATPMREEVIQAMEPYFKKQFANPQANHKEGREARTAVADSRKEIAGVLSVKPDELVFTSGATESNSLLIRGVLEAVEEIDQPQALFCATDHPSTTGLTAQSDRHKNISVTKDGQMNLENLEAKLTPSTALVSCAYVNNEIGTVQNLPAIREHVNSFQGKSKSRYPVFHTDASQAGLWLPLTPERLKVDAMTINGPKLYGPKGIGLLWVKEGTPLAPLFVGDDPHKKVSDYQTTRPGTLPVPLVAGFKEAISWAQKNHEEHQKRVSEIRDYGWDLLQENFPSVVLNGSKKNRIANNISITFPNTDHDYLQARLNQVGIAISTTSACRSEMKHSPTLASLPTDNDEALRISLGLETKRSDIDYFVQGLKQVLKN